MLHSQNAAQLRNLIYWLTSALKMGHCLSSELGDSFLHQKKKGKLWNKSIVCLLDRAQALSSPLAVTGHILWAGPTQTLRMLWGALSAPCHRCTEWQNMEWMVYSLCRDRVNSVLVAHLALLAWRRVRAPHTPPLAFHFPQWTAWVGEPVIR